MVNDYSDVLDNPHNEEGLGAIEHRWEQCIGLEETMKDIFSQILWCFLCKVRYFWDYPRRWSKNHEAYIWRK